MCNLISLRYMMWINVSYCGSASRWMCAGEGVFVSHERSCLLDQHERQVVGGCMTAMARDGEGSLQYCSILRLFCIFYISRAGITLILSCIIQSGLFCCLGCTSNLANIELKEYVRFFYISIFLFNVVRQQRRYLGFLVSCWFLMIFIGFFALRSVLFKISQLLLRTSMFSNCKV